jgi:hypothetical protein
MTDQHRATPEQWALVASEAADGSATHSCMLEINDTLRALCIARNDLVVCSTEQNQRIEALEATQLEQAESHRFCVDAIVRRVEALELAHRVQSGTLTSAERAELGVVPVANMEAAAHRAAAEARDAVMADLSHLSGAEREQVAQELASPAAWRPLDVETTYGSGDAQRIAQELLKPRAMVVRGSFEHGGKQFSYEAEAMEAERPPHQDKLDRLIALDREDPTPDPAMTEPHPASAEMRPAGGLVERVRRAIGDDAPCSHSNARAAIREVAAAARETGCASAQGLINWLEQETNRG